MRYGTWDDIPNAPSPTSRPRSDIMWDSRLNAWKDSNGNIVPGFKSYDETPAFWQKYEEDRRKRGKEADDGPAVLGVGSIYQHFRGISPQELGSGRFSRPVSVLDIETGHNHEPISVSVIQGVVDKRTGEFRVIDALERYYTPKKTFSASFNMSREVHGLTKGKIAKLRELQGATYSETFDATERNILKDMLSNTLVVGHNVEEFDFSKLGMAEVLQNYKTLDTLIAAENMGVKRGKRGLDPMFRKMTGRTMKQAGYKHHIGFHDVLANAELYSKLYMMDDTTGRDIRYVTNHPGVSYGKFEEFAGTGIIKGGYWAGRGPHGVENYMYEDEFDERGVFERAFDDDGNLTMPYGFHEETASDVLGEDGESAAMALYTLPSKLKGTIAGLTEELSRVRESMGAFNISQYTQLEARVSRMDSVAAAAYLKKKAITGDAAKGILERAALLKGSREGEQYVGAREYLAHLKRSGKITSDQYWDLVSQARTDSAFSPQDLRYMGQEAVVANKERQQQIDADRRRMAAESDYELQQFTAQLNEQSRREEAARFGNIRSMARDISEEPEGFDRNDAMRKLQYLHKMERSGKLSTNQLTSLQNLSGSYDDLVDATDDLIKKNQQLLQVYDAIGKVRMYDPNQYLASARNQATGIFGAARGVVPSFLLNPASRLTDAMFNYQQGKLTGFNAVSRTWNSGIGSAITGILGATMGVPGLAMGTAVTGGVNAVSQVVGNIGQYRLEKAGFEIQNTLNTLGAAAAWVVAPFRMLGKAAKTLLGSFTGLSFTLNHLMKGGLTEMSSMGNPLTELTGVGYSDYQGTTMMDIAALFNKGSMNAAYENFANQQRALYTTGEMNQSRLIAASMLGMFDQVYGQSTDIEGQYNGMVNTLLRQMKGQSPDQRARTMYLASQIDSNLPGLLHTANMLGVTDVSTLMDPGKYRDMYWRPVDDKRKNKRGLTEEQQFRWDQYEFGAARTQLGVTKMRFADKLWNAVGRDLYNGFNRLADSALAGNWDSVIESATEMWEKFKAKFIGVWDGIKNAISGEGKSNDWGTKFVGVFAKVGVVALEVVRTIANAWGQLVALVMDKAQGLISYLSTISIKPHYDKDKGFSFEIKSITDNTVSDKDKIGSQVAGGGVEFYNDKGVLDYTWNPTGAYGDIAKQLYPEDTERWRSYRTVGELKQTLRSGIAYGAFTEEGGKEITIYGNKFRPTSAEAVDALMNIAQHDPGNNFDAALWSLGEEAGHIGDYVYTGTRYGNALRNFTDQVSSTILDPAITAAQQGLMKTTQRLEMNIKVNDQNVAEVAMDNSDPFSSKVRTMLSNLVPNNLSIQVSQQR